MLHLFVMVILKLVNVQYISSSATGLSIRAKQTMFAENWGGPSGAGGESRRSADWEPAKEPDLLEN